jgi:hypothetical protein
VSRVSLDVILDLPTEARVEIAQQIWESLFEHPESVPVTRARHRDLTK